MKLNNHGGKRPGAGRPKVKEPKKNFPLRVTEAECVKLKVYLNQLRNE